jgi:DNA-binding NarL/FixJ family response regulator
MSARRGQLDEVDRGPAAASGAPSDARGGGRTCVVIVDDATSCRRAVRGLLERRGYCVVGEADCVARAIGLVERLSPDAVLLDVHLPDGNGFALAARLGQSHPEVAVLLTSADFESSFYVRADVSGARGFVPKGQLAEAELAMFWPPALTA